MKFRKTETEKFLDANLKWVIKSIDLLRKEDPEEAIRLEGNLLAVVNSTPWVKEHIMKMIELVEGSLRRTLEKSLRGELDPEEA